MVDPRPPDRDARQVTPQLRPSRAALAGWSRPAPTSTLPGCNTARPWRNPLPHTLRRTQMPDHAGHNQLSEGSLPELPAGGFACQEPRPAERSLDASALARCERAAVAGVGGETSHACAEAKAGRAGPAALVLQFAKRGIYLSQVAGRGGEPNGGRGEPAPAAPGPA